MGAHDYIVTFHEADESKVRKLWEQKVEDDRFEHGADPYNGTSTTMRGQVKFYDRRCASKGDAQEFILGRHEKWGAPIACSFFLPAEMDKHATARADLCREKLDKVSVKLIEANRKVRAEFAAAKSKLVACKGCGSRMSREHLLKVLDRKPIRCPLCDGDLLSETFRKKQALLTDNVKRAQDELNEALRPKPSTKIGWCVGGWAAS